MIDVGRNDGTPSGDFAANQVGRAVRIAVVEVEPGNPRYPYKPPIPLTVMVNPAIEAVDEETIEINEGCLSVPDLRGYLERHADAGYDRAIAVANRRGVRIPMREG